MRCRKLLGLALGIAPAAAFGQNLVVDGDFETTPTSLTGATTIMAGSETLFSTQYSYQDAADIEAGYIATTQGDYTKGLAGYGTVGVWDDPTTAHNLWKQIENNPAGNHELLVNGGPDSSAYLWQGELTQGLVGGKEYSLSVDLASIYPESQADVQFNVGGQTISFQLQNGVTYDTSTDKGEWHTYTADFVANSSGILAVDLNTVPSGNDFAMDNVNLQAAPEPFTMVLGAAGIGLAVRRKIARR